MLKRLALCLLVLMGTSTDGFAIIQRMERTCPAQSSLTLELLVARYRALDAWTPGCAPAALRTRAAIIAWPELLNKGTGTVALPVYEEHDLFATIDAILTDGTVDARQALPYLLKQANQETVRYDNRSRAFALWEKISHESDLDTTAPMSALLVQADTLPELKYRILSALRDGRPGRALALPLIRERMLALANQDEAAAFVATYTALERRELAAPVLLRMLAMDVSERTKSSLEWTLWEMGKIDTLIENLAEKGLDQPALRGASARVLKGGPPLRDPEVVARLFERIRTSGQNRDVIELLSYHAGAPEVQKFVLAVLADPVHSLTAARWIMQLRVFTSETPAILRARYRAVRRDNVADRVTYIKALGFFYPIPAESARLLQDEYVRESALNPGKPPRGANDNQVSCTIVDSLGPYNGSEGSEEFQDALIRASRLPRTGTCDDRIYELLSAAGARPLARLMDMLEADDAKTVLAVISHVDQESIQQLAVQRLRHADGKRRARLEEILSAPHGGDMTKVQRAYAQSVVPGLISQLTAQRGPPRALHLAARRFGMLASYADSSYTNDTVARMAPLIGSDDPELRSMAFRYLLPLTKMKSTADGSLDAVAARAHLFNVLQAQRGAVYSANRHLIDDLLSALEPVRIVIPAAPYARRIPPEAIIY